MEWKVISNGKKDISQQDIDAVVDVLKSDFLTQAPQISLFEKNILRFLPQRKVRWRQKMTKSV
mgnify:CR=1 FL=1|jgi:dTDP-4-amino-4,6-dideoxygalactose transaminase